MSASFVVVAKRDCPTCELVQPVLREIAASGAELTVYTQDDPTFPEGMDAIDDRSLERSWHLGIETVPTLIRLEGGTEAERTVGWDRAEWNRVTGLGPLGADLPGFQPGCGSKSVDPGMPEILEVAFGKPPLKARVIDVHAPEDEHELCFSRGWSDGLPVVPPTPVRVLRMLKGTTRDPQDAVGAIPPNNAPCTVEKVAINAVMAGCKPEYMPVVLAVVEAALEPEFAMHGLLCTTWFSGPMVVVNGPIARRIGMNSGVNALGQGNRANASIGRALQLVIRNVGGGVPGGIDRATLGWPGKYTLCFAEDESDPDWQPLSVERGIAPGASAVTLFGAGGLEPEHGRGLAHPGIARPFSRDDPQLGGAPEARAGHRCISRAISRALGDLQGRGMGPGPDQGRAHGRDGASGVGARARGERSRRGRQAGARRGLDDQVPRRRIEHRARRRRGRAHERYHRGMGGERPPRHHPGHQGGEDVNDGIQLLDPTAETASVRRERRSPPPSLEGVTLGLLDIGKARGNTFLDRLESNFEGRGLAVKRYAKPTNTRTAPIDLAQTIAEEVDVVVDALSD